jgi:hypothetical protein
MPNEDPQTLWQSQSTEEIKMSTAQFFRVKAEQSRATARLVAIATVAAYIGLLGFLALGFARILNLTSRVGLALLAAGASYVFYRGYNRLWPQPETSTVDGLEAYRRELVRVRDRDSWQNIWPMAGPLIPGCLLIAAPYLEPLARTAAERPAVLLNATPFFVLLAVWAVLIFPVRKRRLQEVQRELEALDRMAR